jgi:hypothetical protein
VPPAKVVDHLHGADSRARVAAFNDVQPVAYYRIIKYNGDGTIQRDALKPIQGFIFSTLRRK